MATTKPGPAINLEEEAEGDVAALDGSVFIPNGEATNLLVCFSPLDDREINCNPYFPFSGPISDSESDSDPDPYNCPIDFLDRDAAEYLESERLNAENFNIWGFYDPKETEEEIVLGSGSGSDQQGLRVTGIDSDSDYEDGVFDFTSDDRENDSGRVEVGTVLPPVWDYVLGEETILADEEWEDVQNAINWTARAFRRSEDEEEEEEELTSVSRISSRDDQEEHELDWQVLLTVNNVVNYIEQAEGIIINPDDIDPNYYLYLASLDEYDDSVLGEETGNRGNPPTSKRVIQDLQVLELTKEEINKTNIVCAVCKDEMIVEEKVRKLPCDHIYHGECIIPWLEIRNTCPVCRFELPTDDLEYESYKRSQSYVVG